VSALTIRGVVGQIKWHYYNAAAINGYTVTRTGTAGDATWSLRGTVVLADAFKMAQQPLMFIAPTQHGEWRWPILSVQMVDGSLTATLGPPVE
jgi:hypothetical protein